MTENEPIAEPVAELLPEPPKIPPGLALHAGRGRPPGKANRITRDMRRAAQFIIDKRRDRFLTWIDRVGRKDPAYACELYIKLLATYTPRPQASFEAVASSTAPGEPSVLALRIRQVLEAPVP
jgi:hypothetical protein